MDRRRNVIVREKPARLLKNSLNNLNAKRVTMLFSVRINHHLNRSPVTICGTVGEFYQFSKSQHGGSYLLNVHFMTGQCRSIILNDNLSL